MILGYWSIRGLAQPIRLVLEYGQIPYRERRYLAEGPPSYSRKDWTDEKEKLGMDFPNLPYLFDGDLKLTQSTSIIRYVARKAGLVPTDEKTLAKMEMLEGEVIDFRDRWVEMCYSGQQFEAKKGYHFNGLPTYLTKFEKWMSKNKWLAGDVVTYVDFMFYECLDAHCTLWEHLLDDYPCIKAFMSAVEKLPHISEYLKSDKNIKRPINNPSASYK